MEFRVEMPQAWTQDASGLRKTRCRLNDAAGCGNESTVLCTVSFGLFTDTDAHLPQSMDAA